MKVLFLVLNKIDKYDELIHVFVENKITGATIINSNGMMHQLVEEDGEYSFLFLRDFLNPQKSDNKTLFMVVDDAKVKEIVDLIESVVGDLNTPDTGIVFTMPVDFQKGLIQWK